MAILPVGIELIDWAAALRNEYADQDFPILTNEGDWKEWGNMLQTVPVFKDKGIPDTSGFADWKSWAQRFTQNIGA